MLCGLLLVGGWLNLRWLYLQDGAESTSGTTAGVSQTDSTERMERAIIHDIEQNIRSGKILKIQLKNFMCHRNMVVEFNKRANLLVGNNGSGKSAVLAALTIGLGCSASATNRSSSLKRKFALRGCLKTTLHCTSLLELIKHGESQATIEIHLENDSVEAYERDVYGDKIIVTRTISASGSSAYKLKSESGQVVTTSRAELQKMILFLNIQVDNPVCVLNQDLARSFLKDSDEKKQYTLFLKATQVEAIMAKLNGCTPQYENAKHNLECNERSLRFLEGEITRMKEKYENLQSVEKLKEKMKDAQHKLGWRVVSDKTAECSTVEQQLGEKLDVLKEQNDAIQNRSKIEAEIETNIKRHLCDIEAKKVVYGEVKEKYVQARRIGQQLQEQLGEKKRQMQKVKERVTRQTDDINSLETDMQERSES